VVEEREVVCCSMLARVLARGANASERVESFWWRPRVRTRARGWRVFGGGTLCVEERRNGSQSAELNGAMEQLEEERNEASYSIFSLF
jgi:hypothetical protein